MYFESSSILSVFKAVCFCAYISFKLVSCENDVLKNNDKNINVNIKSLVLIFNQLHFSLFYISLFFFANKNPPEYSRGFFYYAILFKFAPSNLESVPSNISITIFRKSELV